MYDFKINYVIVIFHTWIIRESVTKKKKLSKYSEIIKLLHILTEISLPISNISNFFSGIHMHSRWFILFIIACWVIYTKLRSALTYFMIISGFTSIGDEFIWFYEWRYYHKLFIIDFSYKKVLKCISLKEKKFCWIKYFIFTNFVSFLV